MLGVPPPSERSRPASSHIRFSCVREQMPRSRRLLPVLLIQVAIRDSATARSSLQRNNADGRGPRTGVPKANPPAKKRPPDAKPPAFFATLFGIYFPRRSSCFVTQLLAMLAM